jgi:hypothetical protein
LNSHLSETTFFVHSGSPQQHFLQILEIR